MLDSEVMTMSANHLCPNCNSTDLSIFFELKKVPVHSVLLLPTREQALDYPKGDIALGFCQDCGFISNVIFDPRLHEYSTGYESTQGFSSTFSSFNRRLATRLIERFDLHNKNIIEIGCGQGEFLNLLCELGGNRGVGFDPAYSSERSNNEISNRILFIKDFYSEKYAHHQADFVCCKMTLEHIQNTAEFVNIVRRSIGDRPDTIVFFQVPDVTRILKEIAFWDIYYEHCSYFSSDSLYRLFRRCGFEVISLIRDYDDQYLMIEARPGNGQSEVLLDQEDNLATLKQDMDYFAADYRNRLEMWRRHLREIKERGQQAVIWGGGSKAVAFLTTLNIQQEIEYAVDINPYKHGTYLPGTGQKIVAPEFLKENAPDVVIVMNPIYSNEIKQDLDEMGVAAQLVPVNSYAEARERNKA
jgi:SAM-dependent methyltransferase